MLLLIVVVVVVVVVVAIYVYVVVGVAVVVVVVTVVCLFGRSCVCLFVRIFVPSMTMLCCIVGVWYLIHLQAVPA